MRDDLKFWGGVAVVGFVVVVSVLLLAATEASSQQPSFPTKPEHAQSEKASPEQLGTEQVLPAPRAPQEIREAAKDRKQKAKQERLLLIFNGLLAFFTFLLVVATFLLWRTNKGTTKATEALATSNEPMSALNPKDFIQSGAISGKVTLSLGM